MNLFRFPISLNTGVRYRRKVRGSMEAGGSVERACKHVWLAGGIRDFPVKRRVFRPIEKSLLGKKLPVDPRKRLCKINDRYRGVAQPG